MCESTGSNGWWDRDRRFGDLDVEVKGRKKVHGILYASDFIQQVGTGVTV